VSFRCYFYDHIAWKHNNGPLPKNAYIRDKFNTTLLINDVDTYNEGIYSCRGEKDVNDKLYSTEARLHVISK